jgi:hypothetical protein
MKKYFILVLLISSCAIQDKKFDSKTWQAIDGNNFSELREPMVNDLMENNLYKGMFYYQVIQLLGKPDIFGSAEKNEIGYRLLQDYSWDIDPIKTKDLIIELNKDSTIKSYKIVNWKK